MRVRIIRSIAGVLDSHRLSGLKVGDTYDLSDSLANQLISMRVAQQEPDVTAVPVSPIDSNAPDESHLMGGVTVIHPKDKAAHRRRRS